MRPRPFPELLIKTIVPLQIDLLNFERLKDSAILRTQLIRLAVFGFFFFFLLAAGTLHLLLKGLLSLLGLFIGDLDLFGRLFGLGFGLCLLLGSLLLAHYRQNYNSCMGVGSANKESEVFGQIIKPHCENI